jgi:diguanylate cyclase (GGDEF)-like protein
LKPDVFYIALYNEDTHILEFPFFYDFGKNVTIDPYDIRGSPGLTAEVIRSRKTLCLADLQDPETARLHTINRHNNTPPSRAYVGVPMIIHDHVVGVVSIQDYHPGVFDEQQVRLLETIATQAAIAIQNARLYSEVQQLATVDALTGVYNRRGLAEFGQREVSRALRFKRPLAILFVDIDQFKQFNDRYSYEVGDQMLRAITRCLHDNLRDVDLIGRYGGEEFVVLLPEIVLEGAIEIAERLRKAVAALRVIARPGELVVTISIGVTTFAPLEEEPSPVHSEEQILNRLIDAAGQMLHLAKDRGRNCVAAPT